MKQRIIMTKGLPASGKSTYAKQMLEMNPGKVKRVNKDDLRALLDNSKWSKANEKFILVARDRLIEAALEQGFSVICDDTNLDPKHEEALRALASLHWVEFEIKDFTDVPPEECIKRDQKRPNYVGEKVIRQMHRQYLQKTPERPVHNPDLNNATIFDMDGTLALLNGRDPYDASTCENDLPNDAVYQSLVGAYMSGHDIIIVSGRMDTYLDQTAAWLDKYQIPYDRLFMRKAGDTRNDAIVKQEIYEAEIKDHWNVVKIYDDRTKVVDMWRSLGLWCFQVNYGDF